MEELPHLQAVAHSSILVLLIIMESADELKAQGTVLCLNMHSLELSGIVWLKPRVYL